MCKAQGLRHVSQATYKTNKLVMVFRQAQTKGDGLIGHLMVNLKTQAQR